MTLKDIFTYLSCVSPMSYVMDKYSENGDKLINTLLDKFAEEAILTDYTIDLPNGYRIWTSNFPYSYGNLWEGKGSGRFRLKTKTRYRVRKLQLSLKTKEERERDVAIASLK